MPISTGSRILIVLVSVLALLIIVGLVDPDLAPSIFGMAGSDALKTLNTPWFHLGPRTEDPKGLDVTPALIIQMVVFLILLTLAARMGRRFLHTRILRHTSMDPGQQYAIANILGYVLFFFGLMIGLQTAGLDLSSLTVLGGAVGIGIGFGLQAIVNNFVSGLILLVERPIKVGDRIEIGGTAGDVMRIGPRSTWVRGNNNAVIIMPNSDFITGRVMNWTAIEQKARLTVSVGVAYGSDPEKVRSLLMGVARAHPDVQQDPPPDVILTELADSAIRFELRFWTSRQVHTPPRIGSDLYFGILKAFREHGIEIPFPQRDVHLKTVPESVSAVPQA
jgi:small-conductance mechanosensitive channel